MSKRLLVTAIMTIVLVWVAAALCALLQSFMFMMFAVRAASRVWGYPLPAKLRRYFIRWFDPYDVEVIEFGDPRET